MTTQHLRYTATDDELWDLDLKLEGFSEEHIAYWKTVIHREMMLFSLLYPEEMRIPKEFHEELEE